MLSHATLPHGLAKSTDNAATDFSRHLLELLRRLLRDADRRLTPAIRHIGLTLLDKCSPAAGCSWPGYRWFQRKFGYSPATIAKAIRVLVDLDYIVVQHRRRRTNLYRPCLGVAVDTPPQAVPECVPEPCPPRTSIGEAPGASVSEAQRAKEYRASFSAPDSCDTAPDEAIAPAVAPPKVPGKVSRMPSEGEPPEPPRPNPAQREMLLPFTGGLALTPAELKRRADRLCQKAITGQDYGTVERLLAYWGPALEPVVEAAVRAGHRDDTILQDIIWPTLRRCSATISA